MSRVLLSVRAALAFALVLSVAAVAPADDTMKKKSPGKKPAAPKLVAMDSLDIAGLPKLTATSRPGERSRESLEAVLAQFQVGTNKRYLPRSGRTFCNIYARDVSYAMGVKLPYGMRANGIFDWLPSKAGKAAGWVAVTPADAQKLANEGRPVVVSFKNRAMKKVKGRDGKMIDVVAPGHIAVVRPSDQPGGPWLSNAGAKNADNIAVGKIFSAARMKSIRYYANR